MNDAIVVRVNEPECAVGDKKPPSKLKVTIESDEGTITFHVTEKDSKPAVFATVEGDGESETHELPERVAQRVEHAVGRLLIIAHTAIGGQPLCANCGHERVLHVPGQCAGDLYQGGRTCNCQEFKTP